VPLKVQIRVKDGGRDLTCHGETIVVSLHGALLATETQLETGTRIMIRVYLTDKSAKARVVYVDSRDSLRCGIELDEPRNIWGISLAPEDWDHGVGRFN
jgi:hypothetical protein